MESKATVLVPLYIYPITTHPNVDFLVIVNPNSGPGGSPLPSHDYVREVPKLNAHPNVTTVGYIKIDYCKRPLSETFEEIETYAGWAKQHEHSGLFVEGIFVDETPNHYSTDRAQYLDAVLTHIKSSEGILRDKLVIHNPGTPPDAGLADPGPDMIVTCEEPYGRYKGQEVQQRLREYHYDQPRSGYMISAVPEGQIEPLVSELRHRGSYLFVTDLVDDFYESFGESWSNFVAAIETGMMAKAEVSMER
ncbi:putative cell surface protein [Phaeomoniella chlamydospora]|uniref:Putative cell surface protein n=1 Tax=Phaeomoniella chlamydospora TaxID=158046 RepID=A0A0G2H1Z3_PHACM|nr:putative cell surface protein [Phaeomoniella chlamydospora]